MWSRALRWLIPALLAGAVATGCTQEAPLFSALSEVQANRVKAALVENGISARKVAGESGKWAVRVSSERVPEAMEVLHAEGLPARSYKTMGELFKTEGFVSSPTEQRARYLFGLSQELEQTLTSIDGVIDARVHLALPEKKPLEKGGKEGSASVVIIHRPGTGIEQRETGIRAIVTDGLERIQDPNRVTVQMFERPEVDIPDKPDSEYPDREMVLLAGGGALGGLLIAGIVALGVWLLRRGRTAVPATQDESGGDDDGATAQ